MQSHPELTISQFWRRSGSDLAVYCYGASGNLICFFPRRTVRFAWEFACPNQTAWAKIKEAV
jgi:hypothetical protein